MIIIEDTYIFQSRNNNSVAPNKRIIVTSRTKKKVNAFDHSCGSHCYGTYYDFYLTEVGNGEEQGNACRDGGRTHNLFAGEEYGDGYCGHFI